MYVYYSITDSLHGHLSIPKVTHGSDIKLLPNELLAHLPEPIRVLLALAILIGILFDMTIFQMFARRCCVYRLVSKQLL